jgi:RHS repeat-associated protein
MSSFYARRPRPFRFSGPAGVAQTASLESPEAMAPAGRTTRLEVPGIAPVPLVYEPVTGRLVEIVQDDGVTLRRTQLLYDDPADAGFLSRVLDASGRELAFDYDGAGRVTRQVLPDLREVGFTYDDNGNLAMLTPPGRPDHVFQYDAIDQQSEYQPPGVAGIPDPRTFYAYDLDRNLDLVTRPDGQSVDLQYDAAGRLAFLVRPAGTTSFAYDDGTPQAPGTGHLASIATPGGEGLAFAYDGFLGTGSTWSGPVAGSVGRVYDDFLRVATETVDVGAGPVGVGFSYDLDGLLTGAGALTITRDPGHGLVTATTLGGTTTAQGYNAFGELATFSASHGGSALYAEDVSQRDALGRITRKVETLGGATTTTDYTYDLAGRLDTVTVDSALVRDFTYDANGNRLSLAPGDPTPIASTDAQDRLVSYQGASYTYTANGELLSKTEGTDVISYATDTLGNLTQVGLPDGRTLTYVIDGMNRRVGKQVDTGSGPELVQGLLYRDALNPVAELDGSGAVVARFVYGTKPHVPDYMVKGGVTYRIVSDHLGSVRLVVNVADGSIAQQIDYDEFGQVTQDTNPGFQPFGFAGGLYDADTGLVRFGARDYDPAVGRWTAKDPGALHYDAMVLAQPRSPGLGGSAGAPAKHWAMDIQRLATSPTTSSEVSATLRVCVTTWQKSSASPATRLVSLGSFHSQMAPEGATSLT